jgi:hypothetical protein
MLGVRGRERENGIHLQGIGADDGGPGHGEDDHQPEHGRPQQRRLATGEQAHGHAAPSR